MPALAAALFLAVPILACPAEPTAATPTAAGYRSEVACDGLVLGDAVNVRAGPGLAYDVVTQLAGGTEVAILGEAFGWYLVRPLTPLEVYVSRDLVEPKGDGVAVVTRDRVNIRSKPALAGTVVGQANRGDLVRLLDVAGDFVKIAAPPDVCFYIHRELVRRLDPATKAAEASGLSRSEPAPGPTPPSSPSEKVLHARDLYLAELDKAEIGDMDFAVARRLFEEAAREATDDQTRALALKGLKRVEIAAELQGDYRRRLGPIERRLSREGADPH